MSATNNSAAIHNTASLSSDGFEVWGSPGDADDVNEDDADVVDDDGEEEHEKEEDEEADSYDSDATGTVGGVRLQPQGGSAKSHDSDVEVEEEDEEGVVREQAPGQAHGSSGGVGTGAGTGAGSATGTGGLHAGKRSRSALMQDEETDEEDVDEEQEEEEEGEEEEEEEDDGEWVRGSAPAPKRVLVQMQAGQGPGTTTGRPAKHKKKLPTMSAHIEAQLLRAIRQYHPAFDPTAHYRGPAFNDALQRACAEGVACGSYPAWAAYWAECCGAQGGSGVLGPLREKLAHNLYGRASNRKRTGQPVSGRKSQPLQTGGSGRVVERDGTHAYTGDGGEGVTAGTSAATAEAGERAAPRRLAVGPAAHADLLHGRYHEVKPANGSSKYYVLDIFHPALPAPAPSPSPLFTGYITFSAQVRGRPTKEMADMKVHILQQLARERVISMAVMDGVRGLASVVGLEVEYTQLSKPMSSAQIAQARPFAAAPSVAAAAGTAASAHAGSHAQAQTQAQAQALMAHATQALLLANMAVAAPASAVCLAPAQGEARFYTKQVGLAGSGYFLLQEMPVGGSAHAGAKSSSAAPSQGGPPQCDLVTGSAAGAGAGAGAAAGFHMPPKPHPASAASSSPPQESASGLQLGSGSGSGSGSGASPSSTTASAAPVTGAGIAAASGAAQEEEEGLEEAPTQPPVTLTSTTSVGNTSTSATAEALHKLVHATLLHALALGQGVNALRQLCVGTRWSVRWVPQSPTPASSAAGPGLPPHHPQSAGTVSWQQQVQLLDRQLRTLGTKTLPWTPVEIAAMHALGDFRAIVQAPVAQADAQRALPRHVPLLSSLFSNLTNAGMVVGAEVLRLRKLLWVSQQLAQRLASTTDAVALSNLSTLSTWCTAQSTLKHAALVELAALALQWKALLSSSPTCSATVHVRAQVRSEADLLALCQRTATRHRLIQAEMARAGNSGYQGNAGENFSVLAPAILQQLQLNAPPGTATGSGGTREHGPPSSAAR